MTEAIVKARLTTRSRARVVVVQQPMKRDDRGGERPAFDFSSAEEFGKVEILAANGRQILTPDIFRRQLEEKLVGFDPDRDYVIAAGDYTVLFFVGMILGEKFGRCRILRWVASAKEYQPIHLVVKS